MVLKAVFDGEVFRPTGPLPAGLKPGDEVDVQTPADAAHGSVAPGSPYSALQILADAKLEGPEDWASELERKYPNGPD